MAANDNDNDDKSVLTFVLGTMIISFIVMALI
jgi:hypothetical protein